MSTVNVIVLSILHIKHINKHNYQQLKPLSANPTKWLNTLKQLAGCCRRNV